MLDLGAIDAVDGEELRSGVSPLPSSTVTCDAAAELVALLSRGRSSDCRRRACSVRQAPRSRPPHFASAVDGIGVRRCETRGDMDRRDRGRPRRQPQALLRRRARAAAAAARKACADVDLFVCGELSGADPPNTTCGCCCVFALIGGRGCGAAFGASLSSRSSSSGGGSGNAAIAAAAATEAGWIIVGNLGDSRCVIGAG